MNERIKTHGDLEVFAKIAIIDYYQRPPAEMASAPSRCPSSAGGR